MSKEKNTPVHLDVYKYYLESVLPTAGKLKLERLEVSCFAIHAFNAALADYVERGLPLKKLATCCWSLTLLTSSILSDEEFKQTSRLVKDWDLIRNESKCLASKVTLIDVQKLFRAMGYFSSKYNRWQHLKVAESKPTATDCNTLWYLLINIIDYEEGSTLTKALKCSRLYWKKEKLKPWQLKILEIEELQSKGLDYLI